MKKFMLLLILLFSYFISNYTPVSNAENGENNNEKAIKMLADKEREEYIRLYQEVYQRSLIQQIEFESEIIIPKYLDFKYVEYAYDLSIQLNLTTRTVFRLIFKESSFIDTIKSPVGAEGLMQLMPEIRDLYRKNLRTDTLNLDKNQEDIYIGLNILISQHEYWEARGNSDKYSWKLTLATYNAGIVAVKKHQGIPPYKETIDFINFILKAHSNPIFKEKKMKTQLQSVHEETYSDGSKTLGLLLNYNEDQTFKESFTFIFNNEKKMYIFFSTIIDMIDYLMYGEMQGKTKVKRAYIEEAEFDQYYDADNINAKFTEILKWV